MATTPTPAPQSHGVFAAVRKTCDASVDGGMGGWLERTVVGALLIPEGKPIVVSAITTVTAPVDVVTPLAVGMPCRDAESRRRRLRSAPMSAAV